MFSGARLLRAPILWPAFEVLGVTIEAAIEPSDSPAALAYTCSELSSRSGTGNTCGRCDASPQSGMLPPCRYVLSNIETRQGLARGDRVWQIAFGSGFKCNSAVWRALRTTNEQHKAWVGVKVSDSDV